MTNIQISDEKPVKKPVPALHLEDFTGESQEPADEVQPTLSDFDFLRVTIEKEYPHQEPVITWAGASIAAPGNITAISAAAKAGKSAFCGVLLAGALSTGQEVDGFADLTVMPNPEGKAVIHMDTEQSEEDQQRNLRTILKRAGLDRTTDNFLSYNIRQLTIEDYQPVTDAICKAASDEFGGIHLIVIDGGADYILSVNDEEQAFKIVEYFTHLSIRFDCPVVIVVHQNPGSDKERGHFGSQIQRKCYGLVGLKKDGDVSIAEPKMMRHAGNDLAPISFKYDPEKGYHVQVAGTAKDPQAIKLNRIEACVREVMKPLDSLLYMDLVRKIVGATACSEATAKRYINVADAKGWIIKSADGRYRLAS